MQTIDHPIPEKSICILGVPLDFNSSYLSGASKAPDEIRQAYFCDSSNLWTENHIDLGNVKNLFDLGDLDLSDHANAFQTITTAVKQRLAQKHHLICLGGDHSITFPVIEAYAHFFERLNILHFDAHPDLYDSLENNRFSHACPFARVMEKQLATRLVQVGIRTMNGHQKHQADRFGVEVHEMKDGFDRVNELHFDGPVYLSIDLDCLDPSFAPGVSHHEPGGMSTRQFLDIVQQVNGRIVGADIVEYNPQRDINGVTSMVTAKLLKEVIARIIIDNGFLTDA